MHPVLGRLILIIHSCFTKENHMTGKNKSDEILTPPRNSSCTSPNKSSIMLARANRLASLLRGGSPTLGSSWRWWLTILWGGTAPPAASTGLWSSGQSCTEHGQKMAMNLLTAHYNQKPRTRRSCSSDLKDQKWRQDGNKPVFQNQN